MTQEEKTDISLDSISKDNLIIMVNDKIKEIGVLNGKNSKLEVKYIALYKEHKNLKKDFDVFTSFLKLIFPSVPDMQSGSIELRDLEVMWSTRQAEFNDKLRKLMHELTEEKTKAEAEHRKEVENKMSTLDQQSKTMIGQMQGKISTLEADVERLVSQLALCQNKCTSKDEEISILTRQKTKIQHQLNNIRVASVKSQLQSSLSAFIEPPRPPVDRNQLLLLRQQLDSALQKNQQLKDKITTLESKVRSKTKEIEMLKSRQSSPQFPKPLKIVKPEVEQQFISPEQPAQKQYIEREYLKNIFVNFMKYLNDGNQIQAEVLQNVLMTILGLNNKERQATAFRRRQWWNIFT